MAVYIQMMLVSRPPEKAQTRVPFILNGLSNGMAAMEREKEREMKRCLSHEKLWRKLAKSAGSKRWAVGGWEADVGDKIVYGEEDDDSGRGRRGGRGWVEGIDLFKAEQLS